ncbi:MAG: lysine--tRNA ligase [Desulfobacterales bacterium]|nr:lysine--tRNA ligase [Desulfobacterales bacterium]
MHWADKIAKEIVQERSDKQTYICAAGISPSGAVHIGNFRDVATAFFVSRSLNDLGKQVTLLFSWDDYDRFRKVPVNVPSSFEHYLGRPYTSVPDPFGCHSSYAAHFASEFEASVQEFGINMQFRSQTEAYTKGLYTEWIILALQKRKHIYDILSGFRSQEASEQEKEKYYPIAVYCTSCGTDNNTIDHVSDDGTVVAYRCQCGHQDQIDIRTSHHCKLPWKIDWPMRWLYEKVDFEPGGRDHATPGGSYYVSKRIAKEIFNYTAPKFLGYEFVGISGATSKMSSSSGVLITPKDILKIYPPEMILWFFAKFAPNKAFNISLDEDVLRQYDEFDRILNDFRLGKATVQHQEIMKFCTIPGRNVATVPFRQLATFSTIIKGNMKVLEEIFQRLGTDYHANEFEERLNKAEYWLNNYSPENIITLLDQPNHSFYSQLNEQEKKWIAGLREQMAQKDMTFEELTVLLYAIPMDDTLPEEESKIRQRRFFSIIYELLINNTTGPRLATFIKALGPQKVLSLISFSS